MTAKPVDLDKTPRRIDWASLAPLVTLLAIIVVFGFLATEFFSLGTISQTLKRGSVLAIVATGLTFVLLCAEIDLSVGTMALFSACVCGVLWAQPFAAGAREVQEQRKTALSLVDKRASAERKRDAAIKERDALTEANDNRREQIEKTIRESTEVIDKATAAIAQAPASRTGTEFRSTAIAVAIPFLVALILGGVSGTLTVSSGLPSFIITLAMMYMANGLARFVTLSQKYDVPQFLKELGNSPLAKLNLFGRTLEIPQSAVLAAVVMIVAHVVLQHTRFGRYVYMTGGNRQAARLAGVRTERIVIGSLMICAVTAACGGMVNAGRLESVSLDQNADLLLEAVACVVLGGTSLFGGEGGIGRTAVGVFTFTILRVGLEATDPARLIKYSWFTQAWKQELLKMSWVTQFDLLRPFLLGIVLMLALVIHGRLVRKHHE
ncbi:MAG TPA: ABC transporter permease [Schlesneria sp.]|jgi:ribose/xylose/arabinose/galactoside ABC-type transport system permease subunit